LAVDRDKIRANLAGFYDFADKVVLCVGADGNLLIEPTAAPKELIAINPDAGSLNGLRESVVSKWSGIPVKFEPRSFESIGLRGDVVYFEFCLHEMADPKQAIVHARSLARDIVIIDHLPGSEWVFLAAEETEVSRSTEAIYSFGFRRRATFRTEQRFRKYGQLFAKLSSSGELALKRSSRFRGADNIRIPLDYGLFLL